MRLPPAASMARSICSFSPSFRENSDRRVDPSPIKASRRPGSDSITETVRVRAVSGDKMMTASTVVTVAAGTTVTVGIQFQAPVRGIIEAGVILDDGAPF